MMRLMRFDFSISHVAGKDLNIADTLSRAPVKNMSYSDTDFENETKRSISKISLLFAETGYAVHAFNSSLNFRVPLIMKLINDHPFDSEMLLDTICMYQDNEHFEI